MRAFLLVLLCAGQAQGIEKNPVGSLGELLLAQHPTGSRKAAIPAMSAAEAGVGPKMQKFQRAFQPKDKKVSIEEIKQMAGVSAPIGYFDPLNLLKNADERKVSFVREVELKNGRLAMLAVVGFVVSENYHPNGGPLPGAYRGCGEGLAFPCKDDETMAAAFALGGPTLGDGWYWSEVMQFGAISEFALFYLFYFFRENSITGRPWTPAHEPGKFPTNGWDPLTLKPKDPVKLKEMQTKELNNGRLAMLAITGMIAQEAITQKAIFR
jgi:choline dehydrogenase-like flavoprotein